MGQGVPNGPNENIAIVDKEAQARREHMALCQQAGDAAGVAEHQRVLKQLDAARADFVNQLRNVP